MGNETDETHRALYGEKYDPVINALHLLGAREKETLDEVCVRRMRELGKEPGTPPKWLEDGVVRHGPNGDGVAWQAL